MKKIFNCIVVILLSFISLTLLENSLLVHESSSNDEKIVCNAKISDSFSEERVLVVLNDEASAKSKKYDKNDFNINGCYEVKDLTSYDNDTKYKNDNEETPKKVLSLELRNSSKEYVLDTIKELIKREDVLYAGPDYKISISSTIPNDYNVDTQWAINSLQLPHAWDFSTGSNNVIVGVMDTGIDGTHPDLHNSIINNLCRDFTSGVEVEVGSPVDPHGHGTHVAGIIGSIGDNNVGLTGTNWDVSLVSLRVFDQAGSGCSSYVAEAIKYAERKNISILNLSGGWYENWTTYDVALDTIIDNYSGLIVCAAGNDGINNDGNNPSLPSSYSCGNIISVGAIDENGNRSIWNSFQSSNYGTNSVDIYAPGSNIASTYPTNFYISNNTNHIASGYFISGGTSMAAPFVTGVSALLLSVNEDLTVTQIKNAILNSAENINITIPNGSQQNVRKLNAYNAVKYVLNNYGSSTTLKFNTKSLSKSVDSTSTFFNEKNYFLKMNVQNAYEYDFTISSSGVLEVTLYDSNFNEINVSLTSTNGGLTKTFSYFLSLGTYYLQSNYVSSTASGTINVSIAGEPHTHSYTVQYYNNRYHKMTCVCGQTTNWQEAHAVLQSEIESGRFATCLSCNHRLDLSFDEAIVLGFNSSSVIRVTINGSYILPSGIIVLVDEDLNAYLNGTLLFCDKDEVPVIQ